jgi:signal transduction histidine kinase
MAFLAAAVLAAGVASPAFSAERATKDEAIAMVNKAVAVIKSDGPDKAYAAFNDKKTFVDRDLYVVVYGLDGKVLAHGANEKLIGQNLMEAKDPDGKMFVKERTDMARAQPEFWQDYKFADPLTKKVEPKQMYCQRLNETAVCAGIYKPQ